MWFALLLLSAGLAAAAAVPRFTPARLQLTASRGGDVTLLCEVQGQGDRAVSWVRARDLSILSHAGVVFAGDARTTAGRDGGRHWLRITQLRAGDAGRYECQLNTEPKMSQFYDLEVVEEPLSLVTVRISQERDGRVSCAARLPTGSGTPPAPRWFLGATELQPDERRRELTEVRAWLRPPRVSAPTLLTCRAAAAQHDLLLQPQEPEVEAMLSDAQAGNSAPSAEGSLALVAAFIMALAGR